MSKATTTSSSSTKPKMRPALTPDAREKQLASAAYDLSEERLLNGTASAQEIVYWLKVGSMREKAERERLAEENKLLRAKTEALKEEKENKVLYEEAIKAMRNYGGYGEPDEYEV